MKFNMIRAEIMEDYTRDSQRAAEFIMNGWETDKDRGIKWYSTDTR